MESNANATPASLLLDDLPGRMDQAGLAGLVEMHAIGTDGDEEMAWLRPDGDLTWLCALSVETPRMGVGRRAMTELCMLADERGCRIGLNPWAQVAHHPGALLQHDLERFYQSLGFGWRRDHVMVRDPGVPTIVDVRPDVPYLPAPNRVELVFDGTQPRSDLTRSAFVIPVMKDGTIVMATNRRRGIEVPGGHIDPGENQEQAARREGGEEAGVTLGPLHVLGHLRMISQGIAPPGWRYPHPLSYQSFFAARVMSITEYTENDECLRPRLINDLSELKPHVRLMARRARAVLAIT